MDPGEDDGGLYGALNLPRDAGEEEVDTRTQSTDGFG